MKENIKNAISDVDKQLLSSHQNERINEEKHAISNMKVNPKHFYTYANKHIKTKSSIGPFRINENLTTSTPDLGSAGT